MISLLGRDRFTAGIDDALAHAKAGRGTLVLVRGEPGIGKSALLAEAVERARAAGAAVTTGRAWELAEAPPYFPVWACLRSLGVAHKDEKDEFGLWEHVLEALANETSSKLVVWAIEDIHAADLLTLDLLTFLAQPLRSLRAMIIATARTNDPRQGDRSVQRLARMARDGVDLVLEPLAPSEVAKLAERIAGRSLSASVTRELAELTNGNPLFVVECARAFRAAGAARPTLPPTVRQVILERVALLPEKTRQALQACAIVGREASAQASARMLGTLPAVIIDALTPAIKAGIVIEASPGQFMFTHILVRDAIEDAIEPLERVKLHGRAYDALDGSGVDVVVERARHAIAALRPDAAELAVAAGKLLEEGGAFDRAYAMYQRADRGVDRLHVARVAQAAGRFAESRSICDAVFAEARASGDPERMARAALVKGAELRPATVDRSLITMLEQAQAALDPRTGTACLVRARLAGAHQPAPDPQVPIAMARDAIARARALNDDALLLEVLELGGSAFVDYAPVAERRALAEEMLERALRVDDVPRALRAEARLAIDLAEDADPSWTSAVDRLLDLSLRMGHPRHRWRPLLLGSMRALAYGEVSTSNELVVEVQQLAALTDDPALTLSLYAHLGSVARLLHRDDDLHRVLELLTPSPDVPHHLLVERVLRTGIYTKLEDRERTARALEELGDARALEVASFFAAHIAEACAFVRDVAACRRLRKIFEGRASKDIVGGHVPITYEGPVARILGLLDSAIGDHASADALLRSALERMKTLGYRSWVAQLHYDRATALARAGRSADAEAEFAVAAERAEEVGMPGLVKRALEKTSVRSRGAEAVVAPFTMTREGETWLLSHAGRELRMKDNRGMQLLARLVERRGEDIHVLVLGSDEGGLVDAGAGPSIDARARDRYRDRLAEIEDDVAEAERNADAGRLEALREEQATLEAEIARAFGLGGRARGSGSPAERARVNVQRRLKDAVTRIVEADASMGRFVEKALRTGTYCRFGV